jgi:hypothetical protein
MMDGKDMFPEGYFPTATQTVMRPDLTGRGKYSKRTECPPKYYFIDFGLSKRYDPADGPPLEVPIWGGDKTVPEFQNSNEPMNPFPTDIYYLGNVVNEYFLQVRLVQLREKSSSIVLLKAPIRFRVHETPGH